MRVSDLSDSLGQLRPIGPEINQFSRESVWPRPFPHETRLIDQDRLITLKPPMCIPDWPGNIQPPRIPNSEGEEYRIKQEMNTVLWPYKDEWAGPWSLNQPAGYKPNWKDGLADLGGGEFPVFEYAITAAGIFTSVAGIRNDRPVLSLVGTLITIAGVIGLARRD